MDNSKHKNEEMTTWSRLWRKLLGTKRFEIETELSPEECVTRLRSWPTLKEGLSSRTRMQVDVTKHVDTYEFTLHTMRFGEEAVYPSASASGVIVRNETRDKTVIRGEVKLSALHLVFIAAPLPTILLFNILGNWSWLAPYHNLLVIAIYALLWLIHIQDRNTLTRMIREASKSHRIANT